MIQTAELRAALATFKHVGLGKTVFPIMAHIRLQSIAPGGLRMTSCDADSEAEYTIEANLPDFDLCVPAQRFAAIVANAGETIELSQIKTGLALASGSGRYRLPVLPGAEMPTLYTDEKTIATGDFALIRAAMARCRFAVGKDDFALPSLNGVNVRAISGQVTVTAANRRLVASENFELDVQDFDLIVPTRATEIAVQECHTDFSVRPGVLRLAGAMCVAKLKLLAAQYPNVTHILQQEKVGSFMVSSNMLVAALTAVAIVKDEKIGSCLIRIKDQHAEISASSALGHADQIIDCEGDEIEFSINIEQLVALAKRSKEKIEFYWGKGFPLEGGNPLLTRNGSLVMGSVTTKT